MTREEVTMNIPNNFSMSGNELHERLKQIKQDLDKLKELLQIDNVSISLSNDLICANLSENVSNASFHDNTRNASPPRKPNKSYHSRLSTEEKTEINSRSVFIGNVEFSATEEDLEERFERFGIIRNVYIPRNHITKKPKSIAFIEFSTQEEMTNALVEDGTYFKGRQIAVKERLSKDQTPKTNLRNQSTYRNSSRRRRDSRSPYATPKRRRDSRSPYATPKHHRNSRSTYATPKRRRDSRSPYATPRSYSRSSVSSRSFSRSSSSSSDRYSSRRYDRRR